MHAARRLSTLLVVLTAAFAGCATGGAPEHAASSPPPADVMNDPGELRCEEALTRLDVLIASADIDPTRTPPALTEARALRGGALELMASGDFDLALDLLNSAIALLDKDAE